MSEAADPNTSLTKTQLERYSRHILLDGIGLAGQKRLAQSTALVIGLGGLGSPIALYLAAAGVGKLKLIDGDQLDLSNLGRQVLYKDSEVGEPKTASASAALQNLNPEIEIEVFETRIDAANADELVAGCDIILEGSDNFPTKFLANDLAVLHKLPLVIGGILRFDAQVITSRPGSFCYRCLFKEPPPADAVPTCSEAGVVGALAGVAGSFMALEAVKYLAREDYNFGAYYEFDGWQSTWRKLAKKQNPDCPVCAPGARITGIRPENYG